MHPRVYLFTVKLMQLFAIIGLGVKAVNDPDPRLKYAQFYNVLFGSRISSIYSQKMGLHSRSVSTYSQVTPSRWCSNATSRWLCQQFRAFSSIPPPPSGGQHRKSGVSFQVHPSIKCKDYQYSIQLNYCRAGVNEWPTGTVGVLLLLLTFILLFPPSLAAP